MRRSVIILLGILLLLTGCGGKKPETTETFPGGLSGMVRNWAGECDADRILQRNLARWYNLNLCSPRPEPGYEQMYNRILYYEGGMMGYVEIPSMGRYIPIYHGQGKPGFSHDPHSAFPLGGVGDHTVLSIEEPLVLSEGDSVVLWVLGNPMSYEIGYMGTDTVTLNCGEERYVCGRAEACPFPEHN